VLAQQQSQSDQDQLSKLANAVATPIALYTRLAAENTPDSDLYYVDRKQVAYDKMMNAQDALSTYQLNAQVNALQAQTSLRKAQASLADAQKTLATAQAGGDKLELAKAQVAVQDAKVSLQAAQKAGTDLVAGADATAIATAKADVDKKQLAVSDAQAALAATKLTATFDGTVLKVNNSVGDLVSSNTVVLTIANLKTLQVSASVDETTIRQVSAGQDAVVSFDAFPNQTFKGTVASVPLQGTLQGGIMVYAVPITLTGTEKLTLLVGMTANVKIQAGSVQNGLLVPTMALTKSNGQYQVLVPNTTDPKADPVATPVEVGLSDGTYTQITKGLNVGDQVVVQVKSSTTSSTSQQGIPGGFSGGAPAGLPLPGGN
jgi:HlyD family secretion protein